MRALSPFMPFIDICFGKPQSHTAPLPQIVVLPSLISRKVALLINFRSKRPTNLGATHLTTEVEPMAFCPEIDVWTLTHCKTKELQGQISGLTCLSKSSFCNAIITKTHNGEETELIKYNHKN